MNNYKFLLLLFSFVIYINYTNYLLPDRDKLQKKTELLKHKIAKENKLNSKKLDTKELQLPYSKLFYSGKKFNYSQAMGDFQESISSAAKSNCTIKRLKWAQVPLNAGLYDVLKIDSAFECKPKDMFVFINTLRKNSKIYNIHNFSIYKIRNKAELLLHMQLISYRVHDEK